MQENSLDQKIEEFEQEISSRSSELLEHALEGFSPGENLVEYTRRQFPKDVDVDIILSEESPNLTLALKEKIFPSIG